MARQWILFLTAGLVLVTTPGLGDENADAAGNALTDPYSGVPGQPALPWRGRITASLAPGVPGRPDGTAAAGAAAAAPSHRAAVPRAAGGGREARRTKVIYCMSLRWLAPGADGGIGFASALGQQ